MNSLSLTLGLGRVRTRFGISLAAATLAILLGSAPAAFAAASGCSTVAAQVNGVPLGYTDGIIVNGFLATDVVSFTYSKSFSDSTPAVIQNSANTTLYNNAAVSGSGTVTVGANGYLNFTRFNPANNGVTVTYNNAVCLAPAPVPTLSPLAIIFLSFGLVGGGCLLMRRLSPDGSRS